METQEILPLELVPETPRVGRDELNLTEFPFAVLASRGSKEGPLVIEFRDGEKEWIVQGSPKYGLPAAADVDVYVVLMELTREQGFPERVQFSRYELIQRLGWDQHGRSYERLTTSLHRLRGISISTKNAFYDAKMRRWDRERSIGIIAEFDISGSREAPPEEPSLFPSWIIWSPHLYRNMQAGYLKSLDVRFFLSLENAVGKALYRYLDAKRYDGKPLYRIGIRKLAFEHLGLSRNYYPSQIKRKLDPAHAELAHAGFIQSAEYAAMRSQPGEEMVIYRFPARGGRNEPPALPDSMTALASQLLEHGISRKDALELARSAPEECERQLQYLPHRGARDTGAVLVKAIREGWGAPPAWSQAQERQQKAAKHRGGQQKAAKATERKAELETAFDQFWRDLSEDRQEEIFAVAEATLRAENRVLADFAAKHPESPMYREALRPYLKRLSGWVPDP